MPCSLVKILQCLREAYSLYPYVVDFEDEGSSCLKTALNFCCSKWCLIVEDVNTFLKGNNIRGQYMQPLSGKFQDWQYKNKYGVLTLWC
jgi:hypothetical protein